MGNYGGMKKSDNAPNFQADPVCGTKQTNALNIKDRKQSYRRPRGRSGRKK